MDVRLPAHLEVSALIRSVNGEGGFATIMAKGEPDSGAILVMIVHRGQGARLYERMPSADGARAWHLSRRHPADDPMGFSDYLARRRAQDRDVWIVELDIADGERFIGVESHAG